VREQPALQARCRYGGRRGRRSSARRSRCSRAGPPHAPPCRPRPVTRSASSQYGREGRDVSSQYGGRDETCPVSTGRGTQRVWSVRGSHRGARGAREKDVEAVRREWLAQHRQVPEPRSVARLRRAPRAARRRHSPTLECRGARWGSPGGGPPPPPPSPSRTKWTRLVPPPVQSGHVSSILQVTTGVARARAGGLGRVSAWYSRSTDACSVGARSVRPRKIYRRGGGRAQRRRRGG
jgi:hypothetical protein